MRIYSVNGVTRFSVPRYSPIYKLTAVTFSLFYSLPLTAFPASFSAITVGFCGCKGLLSRLIRRLEVHFLQNSSFCEE